MILKTTQGSHKGQTLSSGFTTKQAERQAHVRMSLSEACAGSKTVRGFTLVEMIISVGLFAVVMTLASGAYLIMIGVNRQAQNIATGINNLSFALETMTRTIRTGTSYGCPAQGNDCSGGTSFSVINQNGILVTYTESGGAIMQDSLALTDSSVTVSSLRFYASGTADRSSGDDRQPRVTIIVTGEVSSGPGRPPERFTVQTGATMRGSDI